MIRKHQNNKILLFLVIMFCIGNQSAIGATMRCERYLVAGEHLFQDGMNTFNENYPKVLTVNQTDLNKFKKVPNRPVIRYTRKVNFDDSQASGVVQYYLFPNKKLRTTHPQVSDIRAAWNCDMTPDEVLASQPEPATGQSKTITDVISKLNDKEICKASKQGYSAHKKEALRRGLDCAAPTSAQKDKNNVTSSTTMSLQEAKAECTSLGFSAGTEKHGDCVMKLMD